MMRLIVILAFMLSLWPSFAQADPVCTGTSFPFNTPSDPQAQNYTVPTVTNGVTFMFVNTRGATPTVSSITIGGNAATEIGTRLSTANTGHQSYYYINAPSGVQSINVDFSSLPLTYILTAITCDNVNQSNPIDSTTTATGSGTAITVDCTSAVGRAVIDFVGGSNTASGFTPGGGQTFLDQDVADATLSSGMSYEAGASTVTMSHTQTSGEWATRCVSLALAVAPATTRHVPPVVFQ